MVKSAGNEQRERVGSDAFNALAGTNEALVADVVGKTAWRST